MNEYWLPSPRQLRADPQLAAMAALHAILEMAAFALLAKHPEIQGRDRTRGNPCMTDASWMANRILDTIASLHNDIDWYRSYVEKETTHLYKSDDFDDLPF